MCHHMWQKMQIFALLLYVCIVTLVLLCITPSQISFAKTICDCTDTYIDTERAEEIGKKEEKNWKMC